MSKRLTIRAHLNAYTGYGVFLCQTFQWLSRRGIYCAIRAIGGVDEQWGRTSAIPTEMRAQIVQCRQPEEWELDMSPPDNVPTPQRKVVKFTMYESTEMPIQYVQNLNRCAAVIVPCEWNKACFAEQGVKVPIFVVPLGYDPHIFQYQRPAETGMCVFGVAGRTKHCARRKAVQEGIDLFLKTFPGEEDVRLHVKIHPDDVIKEVKDHRIKVERRHFEDYELAHWLRGLTAYLTLSRAEGYGLWALQAMAIGRPVVACKYGGHADFLPDEFAVPFREVEAHAEESNVKYLGLWAEPNLKVAGMHLRSVYAHREEAAGAGASANVHAANLTWENSAAALLDVLMKIGAVS